MFHETELRTRRLQSALSETWPSILLNLYYLHPQLLAEPLDELVGQTVNV